MGDHLILLQKNIFYTLQKLLKFGLSKSQSISKITSKSAQILYTNNLGQIISGYKTSIII